MGQPPDDPPARPAPPPPPGAFVPPPIYAPSPSGEGPPPPPYAPQPGYAAVPAAAPAGRSRRAPVLIAGAAALVLILLVAGVATYLATRGGDGGDGGGPATLRRPLTLQQVAAVSSAPCASGTLPDTEGKACYRLAGGGMTVARVRDMKVVSPIGGITYWAIAIELTSADARAFADLSGRAAREPRGTPANQVAMVVDGRVLSAPAVTSAITGGSLQISGAFTRAEAKALIDRITGRRPS